MIRTGKENWQVPQPPRNQTWNREPPAKILSCNYLINRNKIGAPHPKEFEPPPKSLSRWT